MPYSQAGWILIALGLFAGAMGVREYVLYCDDWIDFVVNAPHLAILAAWLLYQGASIAALGDERQSQQQSGGDLTLWSGRR